jgi:hypothetical protein
MNVSGSTVFSSQNLQQHMFIKPGGSGLTFHEKETKDENTRDRDIANMKNMSI